MENEINVHLTKGTEELILRKGEAAPAVPFRESVIVTGNIDVALCHLQNPSKWFSSVNEGEDAPLNRSYVTIDRGNLCISLYEDAGMPWECKYKGKLCFDEALLKFQINTGASYTTFELSDLFKMNRSWFETKDTAMRLVSELRNFRSKVDKDIQAADDQRGNTHFLKAQVVESNIPKSFKLVLPIFKNHPKQTIEVEVNINASDMSCTLISPELNDFIVETKNEIIDNQKAAIKELFEDLRIFEI